MLANLQDFVMSNLAAAAAQQKYTLLLKLLMLEIMFGCLFQQLENWTHDGKGVRTESPPSGLYKLFSYIFSETILSFKGNVSQLCLPSTNSDTIYWVVNSKS